MYPQPIRPRRRGERRDQELMPQFMSSVCEVLPHLEVQDWSQFTFSAEQVGTEVLTLRGVPTTIYRYVVRRSDGLVIPAWGRGGDYGLCQSTEYKAGRAD